VYLGAEEDDEAAEERNEDRYDDDEREFDQDGREFFKIRPIVWRKQFLTRHGDPGINVFKFLERLVYGLIPKMAADGRLQKAVAGSFLKAFFKGDLSLFSSGPPSGISVASSQPTATGGKGVVRGVADKIVGAVKDAAHSVKDQSKLVEQKMFHRREAGDVDEGNKEHVVYSTTRSPGEAYEREPDQEREEKTPEPISTIRPVHGQDSDFTKSDLLIAGSLDAVWQGRHRITSLFRRWKSWHMEIKGDTVYYHRISSFNSTTQASDSPWYTLDLTWLVDAYITDSSRTHNNELVLKFVQDESTLHFRLPSRITTPSLDDWLAAIRKVAKAQQERRRLGTTGSVSETETFQSGGAWPGEDLKPQQRQRGSSLAMGYAGAPSKSNERVVVEVNKPNEPGNLEQPVRLTDDVTATSTIVPESTSNVQHVSSSRKPLTPMSQASQDIQSQPMLKSQSQQIDTTHSKPLTEAVLGSQISDINKDKHGLQQQHVTTGIDDPMIHKPVVQT
jgi:hypothetical protein